MPLPSAPGTKFDFPKAQYCHSSKLDTIDWEKEGPKTQTDIKEMTGYLEDKR
jgi:hypothetical protein